MKGLITQKSRIFLLFLGLFSSLPIQAQQDFEWQVEPKIDLLDPRLFSEGVAIVLTDNNCSLIDKNGEKTPLKYDRNVLPFSEGLAKVGLNNKYGFIDKNGKEIIPLKYDNVLPFSEGLARVNLNDKYGFIDKNGKEVVPLKYDRAESFSEGMAIVVHNKVVSFIDKNGKEVIPLKYDGVESFSEGLAKVDLNNKHGFIDKNGKEVIPLKYDMAESFSEGMAIVVHNKILSFIDKNGKEITNLNCEYHYIDFKFSEGLVRFRIGDDRGFIDKNGNKLMLESDYVVLDFPVFDKFNKYDYYTSRIFIQEGLICVKLNNKYGYIDKNMKEIITPQFEYVTPFSEGLAWVRLNGKWGIIKNPLLYPPKSVTPPTTHVLAVGIQTYDFAPNNQLGDLKSTDIAALRFETTLTAYLYLPTDNVKTLVNAQARKKAILTGLQEKAQQASSQDVLIFYFAGHGADDRTSKDTYGLFAYDSDKRGFTQLKYTEIFDALEASRAKHKILIIDACGSGAITQDLPTPEEQDNYKAYQKRLQELDKSFIIITSTSAGQKGYDGGNLPVFTKYLLEGLKGKAKKDSHNIITVKSAFDYAKTKTEEFVNKQQTPQIKTNSGDVDKLPFIVVPK